MADIVEVAVTNLKLKAQGIDGAKEFNEKLDRLMLGGREIMLAYIDPLQ